MSKVTLKIIQYNDFKHCVSWSLRRDAKDPLEKRIQDPIFHFSESSSMSLLGGKLKFHSGGTFSQHGIWSSCHYPRDLYLTQEMAKNRFLSKHRGIFQLDTKRNVRQAERGWDSTKGSRNSDGMVTMHSTSRHRGSTVGVSDPECECQALMGRRKLIGIEV